MVASTKSSGATKFLVKGNQDESQNKPQENTKKTSLQQNNYMVLAPILARSAKIKERNDRIKAQVDKMFPDLKGIPCQNLN